MTVKNFTYWAAMAIFAGVFLYFTYKNGWAGNSIYISFLTMFILARIYNDVKDVKNFTYWAAMAIFAGIFLYFTFWA